MGLKLNKILTRARVEGPLTAAFFVAGVALVTIGIAMVYRPAGVIFAGFALVASVFLWLAGESK